MFSFPRCDSVILPDICRSRIHCEASVRPSVRPSVSRREGMNTKGKKMKKIRRDLSLRASEFSTALFDRASRQQGWRIGVESCPLGLVKIKVCSPFGVLAIQMTPQATCFSKLAWHFSTSGNEEERKRGLRLHANASQYNIHSADPSLFLLSLSLSPPLMEQSRMMHSQHDTLSLDSDCL